MTIQNPNTATRPASAAVPTLDRFSLRLLELIRQQLHIEDANTEWHADGFTWWFHQLAQTFRIDRPHEHGGRRFRTLSFTTAFVKRVSARNAMVDSLIDLIHQGGEIANVALVGDRLVQRARIAIYEDAA